MSAPISESTATDMIKAYLAHSSTVPAPGGSGGGPVTLKGLTFDRASLENILNPSDGTQIDKVFFALSVDEGDVGKPEPEQFFTLVAMGIDDQNDLKVDNAFDNAKKCPTECPANYSTLFE